MADSAPLQTPILIVDDEPSIRSALAQLLEEEGYEVAVVRSGREAILYLEHTARRPCLILLDMMMPEMSGLQFRREQQAHAGLADIPVVAMSANLHLAQAAQLLGVTDYLQKPFAVADLLSAVVRNCGPAPTPPDSDAPTL
jgi:CheY-like chemotaxis protein